MQYKANQPEIKIGRRGASPALIGQIQAMWRGREVAKLVIHDEKSARKMNLPRINLLLKELEERTGTGVVIDAAGSSIWLYRCVHQGCDLCGLTALYGCHSWQLCVENTKGVCVLECLLLLNGWLCFQAAATTNVMHRVCVCVCARVCALIMTCREPLLSRCVQAACRLQTLAG